MLMATVWLNRVSPTPAWPCLPMEVCHCAKAQETRFSKAESIRGMPFPLPCLGPQMPAACWTAPMEPFSGGVCRLESSRGLTER